MDNIRDILRQLNGNEDLAEAARRHLDDYRAFSLARPRQENVDVLKALLTIRLTELLAATRRDAVE